MKSSLKINKFYDIINYFHDRDKAKQFLFLQKQIKNFLILRKIKILNQLGIFDDIYIKANHHRPLILSKNTLDKYLSKPIIRYHIPLTKIIMIQQNYKMHLKYIKKFPRYNINKISLNQCPLITKETKIIIINPDEIYKNIKYKVINNDKGFYNKVYYKYTPLLLIQKKYKERFKYLKENFKLAKHAKIIRTVVNKHHYIYHAKVIDGMKQILTIQKNIKYFLYRKHSIINLIQKKRIEKCQIDRSYGFREYIIKYFYEEFAYRLTNIIRKFFLALYLKEIKKNYMMGKISTKKNINITTNDKKRNSFSNESNIHFINKVKSFNRKETFNITSNKIKPLSKPRHSNLINNNDSGQMRDKVNKKKVSFKNDLKLSFKESKNSKNNFSNESDSKSKHNKKSDSNNFIRKKQSIGTIKGPPFYKK